MRIIAILVLGLLVACSGGGSGDDDGDVRLVITPTTLSAATVGERYVAALRVSGGSGGGYTWTLGDGALPTGITGVPGSGSQVMLAGTPAAATVASFTVTVQDSDGTVASRRFALTIRSAPPGGGGNATSLIDAPTARGRHTAVWTGSEMIVWGGLDATNALNTGAAYDPATDSWRPLPMLNAPAPRYGHTAIWTGTEMVVWGGTDFGGPRNDGGAYDPRLDRWRPVSTVGAPIARFLHTAAWTGTNMIVWGGQGVFAPPAPNSIDRVFQDGASYDPATDLWLPISSAGPAVRGHTAVWSGSRMIVWGGHDAFALTINPVSFGFLYDPVGDAWTSVSNVAPPAARTGHAAIWDGFGMLVWGGIGAAGVPIANGKRYAPQADRWTTLSTTLAPAAASDTSTVWTGDRMVVWGGMTTGGGLLNTGGSYAPGTDRWGPVVPASPPQARALHTAVWTGTEMIVWGGRGNPAITYLNSGARIVP